MYFFIASLLFIISFFSRVWIRLLKKDFGVDTWYFLNYAQGFRQQRRLPIKLKHYLLDIEDQWYPPVFAFLLSWIPKKVIDRYHWLVSPIIDSTQTILLFLFSIFLSGRLDIALAAALLYIAGTVNASIASNLNVRPFASLLSTLFMLSIYSFSIQQDILSFLLVLISGVIILHTHKMTTQQLVFFTVGLTLLTRNPIYLYFLLFVFGLAFIATKGFYLKILKNHIQIVKFWSKNLPYLWKHQVYDSPLYKNNEKAVLKSGVYGMKNNRFVFYLARALLLSFLIVVIILFLRGGSITRIPNYKFIFYWVFINYFLVFSTTYLPIFKNIGEGYQYLVYGVFPVSFLVAFAFLDLIPDKTIAYSAVSLLIIISMYIQIFTLSRQLLNVNSFVDNELKEIIGLIKDLKEDRVLCLPVFKSEAIAFLGGKKVLWGAHGSGWDDLYYFYPVIRRPIIELVRKYNIGFILLDKRFVDLDDLKIDDQVTKVFSGKNYYLLKVK